MAINRVGRGDADNQGWFSYDDGTELAQGQLSRAGDQLAAVAGGGKEIHLFGIAQPPPALPALRCLVPGGPFAHPVWSPGGSMLAWQAADGIHVAGPVPDLRQPVPDCSVIRERRLAAGSEPYWGAADVPGATSGPPALGPPPRGGRRPRRSRSGRQAPARPRGPAAPADRPRAGARGGRGCGHGGKRVGRVLRRRAKAGTLRLRVPLNRAARRALARRGRLRCASP